MSRQPFVTSAFNRYAVEAVRAAGTKGIAPGAGQEDTDPDWQPL